MYALNKDRDNLLFVETLSTSLKSSQLKFTNLSSMEEVMGNGEAKQSRRRKSSIENGKKGGVKTEQGKVISSRNALKHGILANALSGYDKINYKMIYELLSNEFKVTKFSHEMILEQLVICYIKLGRCLRCENDLIREGTQALKMPPIGVDYDDQAFIDEEFYKRMELVLTKYEPQLVKRLQSLIKQLEGFENQI
jgi:hypothetical protein